MVMLELVGSGAWCLSARAIARTTCSTAFEVPSTASYVAHPRPRLRRQGTRDNTLACNAIPQKRGLQSHSVTNLTAEGRRHIYKKPDFSRTDSTRNNRLIALCNRLYITTIWIFLDVCRL